MCSGSSEMNADKIILKLREFYDQVYCPLISRNIAFNNVNGKIRSQTFSSFVE